LIGPGAEWKESIDENLERADIILLLVSADFISSDYRYEVEMEAAIKRHHDGKATVLPIIVRDVAWTKAPSAKFQGLPKEGGQCRNGLIRTPHGGTSQKRHTRAS
jgi:internalin A